MPLYNHKPANYFEAFFASKCTDVCEMQAKSDDGPAMAHLYSYLDGG